MKSCTELGIIDGYQKGDFITTFYTRGQKKNFLQVQETREQKKLATEQKRNVWLTLELCICAIYLGLVSTP